MLRQVLDRRIAAAGRARAGGGDVARRGSRPTRCSPRRTRCRSATSSGPSRRSKPSCCALLLLLPDQQLRVVDELGPDQLPATLARELFRAIVLQRAPERPGRPPAVRLARRCSLALDDETARSPGRCMPGRARTRATLGDRQLAYEVTRLLLELEDDQLRERSDYNEAAQAEAERAGDTDSIDRLLLERRQINEARRSLDRRREDTRLLARPVVADAT